MRLAAGSLLLLAAAGAPKKSFTLPRQEDPMVKVFADAVRALVVARIAAAWID